MTAPVWLRNPGIAYRSILSQSTNTLIPGRMCETGETGLTFTAKVRMSNPPCVRVAAHVAKSACGEIYVTSNSTSAFSAGTYPFMRIPIRIPGISVSLMLKVTHMSLMSRIATTG